jgi:hypothetical protein
MKACFSMFKRSIKILSLLLFISVFTGLFSACKKDKKDEITGGLGAISWPQSWLLTIDYDETSYKYIYAPHYIGIAIMRGDVSKSYSLNALATEKDCEWEVFKNGKVGLTDAYTFRSKQNPFIWWQIGQTSNVFGGLEWYLGIEEDDTFPDDDNFRFILHEMPDQNGKKTFAIESVSKRGFYLDNSGHTLTGNGLKFVEFDKPEKATRIMANGLGGYTDDGM